ncbi:MAG: PaaI family thioesterase [Pseudomonadota bacterium]
MDHNLQDAMPFANTLGVKIISAQKNEVVGELTVRKEICTTGDTLHGGAIMAFADMVGGIGAFLVLPDGASGTTTIESKTNFLSGPPIGTVLTATARPVKTGRRLSIWQTDIRDAAGKAVALVTQTQLVL